MRPGALLIDIDGTICQNGKLVPGTIETLLFLKEARIPYHFITNNTQMTKKKLVHMLAKMGLFVSKYDCFASKYWYLFCLCHCYEV